MPDQKLQSVLCCPLLAAQEQSFSVRSLGNCQKGPSGDAPAISCIHSCIHPPRPGQPRPPWRHKEANARTKGLDGEAACCGAQSQLSPSLHSTSPALVSRSMRCCGFWKVVMFSHVLPLDDSNKKIMCPCSFPPPHTHTHVFTQKKHANKCVLQGRN